MQQTPKTRSLIFVIAVLTTLAALRAPSVHAGGVVGSGAAASCTEAAFDAVLAGGGAVTFNCGPAPVTIALTASKVLSANASIDGGGTITLAGNGTHRIFDVGFGHNLVLSNITLTNGNADGDGGAVRALGTLFAENVTISESRAGKTGRGGALYIGSNGGAQLLNVRLEKNSADIGGGAYSEGSLFMTGARISTNSARVGGGLAFGADGPAAVAETALANNTSTENGGGVHNQGQLRLDGVAIYRNIAAHGAGLFSASVLTATNSTIAENTASGNGGGLYVEGGTADLEFSTLANNSASKGGSMNIDNGAVTMQGLLIAGGSCVGAPTSLGHNLDAGASCGLTQVSDLSNANPALLPLADYGGPTWSMALGAGSAAFDAGGANCPKADQRGVLRPQGASCDIGAVETQPTQIVTGRIAGRVTTGKDSALKDAQIRACLQANKTTCSTTQTNSAGDYAFSDVAIGDYDVRADLSGYYSATLRVSVLAGRETVGNIGMRRVPVVVPPPPGGTLAGRVETYADIDGQPNVPLADATVVFQPFFTGGVVLTTTTGADGTFSVPNARPGAYLARAIKANYSVAFAVMTVVVGAETTRTFVIGSLAPPAAMPGSAFDLTVRRVIVSQAAQDWNNAIAVVANHVTEVRAFVDIGYTGGGAPVLPAPIVGTLVCNGMSVEQVGSGIVNGAYFVRNWNDSTQLNLAWALAENTLNFRVPPECVRAGTRTLEVHVRFSNSTSQERAIDNNRGQAAVTFRQTKPLEVLFNPVSLRDDWDCPGAFQPGPTRAQMNELIAESMRLTRRWFPTTVSSLYGNTVDICGALRADGGYQLLPGWWWIAWRYSNHGRDEMLGTGWRLRDSVKMAYGVINNDECTPPGRDCSGTSGYSLGPFGARTGIGRSHAPSTVPHELAHSLYSCHPGSAPHGEGGCYDSFPPFPNAHGGIGQWGFQIRPDNRADVYMPVDLTDHRSQARMHNHDFMSYGPNEWISGHQWLDLLEEFDDDYSYSAMPGRAARMRAAAAASTPQRYLWALGGISDNAAVIGASMPLSNSPASLPPADPDGTYVAQMLDATGVVITSTRFNPAPASHTDEATAAAHVHVHGDGSSHTHASANEMQGFAFLIPFPLEARTLAILTGTQVLVTRSLSIAAPVVTVLSPNGGETFSDTLPVSWVAGDPDGDALTYDVQYSADGGTTWASVAASITGTTYTMRLDGLPGGSNSLVRVVAHDGANSGSDTSNGSFSVPAKTPSALILTRNATVKSNELLVLEGMLLDLEDSDTSPGVTYRWTSDRDGLLGTELTIGAQLLSIGLHTITFTATDRDGNSASATMTVQVGSVRYLPLARR